MIKRLVLRATRPALATVALALFGAACAVGVKSGPADGGIFRSNDGGDTWQQAVYVGAGKNGPITLANLAVTRLVFSPINLNALYAVAADSVWYTENGGEQWRPLYRGAVSGFAPSPATHDTLYLASGSRLFKTIDHGQTWQPIYLDSTGGSAFTDVVIDPKEPKRLFATTNRNLLLRSQDEGDTWQLWHTFGEAAVRLMLEQPNPLVMYAAHASGALDRSADGGATWQPITPTLSGVRRFSTGAFQAIALVSQRPGALVYATKYGLWRTQTGGASWESLALVTQPNTVTIGAVLVDARQEANLIYTADGVFYRSADGGETWKATPLPTSRRGAALIASPTDGRQIYLGTAPLPKKKR